MTSGSRAFRASLRPERRDHDVHGRNGHVRVVFPRALDQPLAAPDCSDAGHEDPEQLELLVRQGDRVTANGGFACRRVNRDPNRALRGRRHHAQRMSPDCDRVNPIGDRPAPTVICHKRLILAMVLASMEQVAGKIAKEKATQIKTSSFFHTLVQPGDPRTMTRD